VKMGFEPTYWHDGCSAAILDAVRRERFAGRRVAFFPAEFWTLEWYARAQSVRPDQKVLEYELGEGGELTFHEREGAQQVVQPDLLVLNRRSSFTTRTNIDRIVAGAPVLEATKVWGEPITVLYDLAGR